MDGTGVKSPTPLRGPIRAIPAFSSVNWAEVLLTVELWLATGTLAAAKAIAAQSIFPAWPGSGYPAVSKGWIDRRSAKVRIVGIRAAPA